MNQPPYQPQQPQSPQQNPGPQRPITLLDRLLTGAPRWFPRDPMSLGIMAAGLLMVSLCVCAFCLVVLILSRPVPAPAITAVPTIDPAQFYTLAPIYTPTPIFSRAKIGTLINPYANANLDGMNALSIEFLNTQSGQYEPSGVQYGAGSEGMTAFETAFNIGQPIAAPDGTCSTSIRFVITRADNSVVTIGACLKGAVILRGDIPGLDGGDLPMGPYFIDVLGKFVPNLPDALKKALGL